MIQESVRRISGVYPARYMRSRESGGLFKAALQKFLDKADIKSRMSDAERILKAIGGTE